MITKEIIDYLNNFNKLAFAVSGGKDSMAMLSFAIQNLDKNKMFVVTIHHNLRGEEGERDRDFVVNFCKKNNIECIVYEEQIKQFCKENGYTIEQGARIRRHKIFEEIVKSKKADRVVLAHHKDDQIESILMHIFRGCGLQGLCGMPLDTKILLRPLIYTSSNDIKNYIDTNNIPFVQDSTNFELEYSRNKIRNVLVNEIEKIYPNFGENILRLSSISNEAINFINREAPKAYRDGDKVYLKIEDLIDQNIATNQAIINAIEMLVTRVDLEKCHIDQVLSLIDMENGKSFNLPFNVVAVKEYDKIAFYLKKESQAPQINFSIGKHKFLNWTIDISMENNGGLRADFDKIKDSIIRTRQSADSFKKFKGGRKSLGKYLTDIKVPLLQRDTLPIIAKDNEIYAVLTKEISDIVAVDEATKEVVYIRADKNE